MPEREGVKGEKRHNRTLYQDKGTAITEWGRLQNASYLALLSQLPGTCDLILLNEGILSGVLTEQSWGFACQNKGAITKIQIPHPPEEGNKDKSKNDLCPPRVQP